MTRWTRRDDEAVREQVEAEEFAREHVFPALAAFLGVDETRLRNAATVMPVRPCRHWRCRWIRANTPAARRAFVAGLAVAFIARGIVDLIGALS